MQGAGSQLTGDLLRAQKIKRDGLDVKDEAEDETFQFSYGFLPFPHIHLTWQETSCQISILGSNSPTVAAAEVYYREQPLH